MLSLQGIEAYARFFSFNTFPYNLAGGYQITRIDDLVTLSAGGFHWKILDVACHGGRRGYEQTAAMTRIRDVQFPSFYLRNECIWDLNICGPDPDVDFKDFPSFSKHFYLTSRDHGAIRNYFTPAIVLKLERLEKIGIAEGYNNYFVYYHLGRILEPERYSILAEEAAGVLRLCLPD